MKRVGRPRDAPPSEVDPSRPIPISLEAVDLSRVPSYWLIISLVVRVVLPNARPQFPQQAKNNEGRNQNHNQEGANRVGFLTNLD